MGRQSRSSVAVSPIVSTLPIPGKQEVVHSRVPVSSKIEHAAPNSNRHQSSRGAKSISTNPKVNTDIVDGADALRASPDGHDPDELAIAPNPKARARARGGQPTANELGITTNLTTDQPPPPAIATAEAGKRKREIIDTDQGEIEDPGCKIAVDGGVTENVTGPTTDAGLAGDPPDAQGLEDNDVEIKEALSRPPPVNSEYLPLPWQGRLGYACLNTYLRNANPPVFSSRTCRIASILDHRHPLKDPSQPEHATKNRPDKDQPADVARGMRYVQELGLANARDIAKMIRWNDKYGIKFMRLSSEMFPFASHDEYGYKLEPFAAETLREVGKVIAELGHRVTTHPGQFTQLGSPRQQVIDNAIRDLEYHDEMLSLLKLPPQQDRDAVMILHLGGAYGDKPAAISRFKENYAKLSQSVKKRLVLENDDVVWSVHELLPLCQELNIPFVLDFHHHNIIFDSNQIREGTKDIMDLFPAIIETWSKKGITPKMHYSEPCPDAITRTQRRKHSPRVMTLPSCPNNMDLMIEAKDKEQAVFELMRTFKLPGFNTFNDILPHQRQDENKPWKPKPKKAIKKSKKKNLGDFDESDVKLEEVEEKDIPPPLIPEDEVGMGGPEGRVYWPPGMEDWLRPPKRVIKKKEEEPVAPDKKKRKAAPISAEAASLVSEPVVVDKGKTPAKKAAQKGRTSSARTTAKSVPTPSSSEEGDVLSSSMLSEVGTEDDGPVKSKAARRLTVTRKRSGRATTRVSYKEEDDNETSL